MGKRGIIAVMVWFAVVTTMALAGWFNMPPAQKVQEVASAKSVQSSQADDKPDLTKFKNLPYLRPQVNLHLFADDRFRIARNEVETHSGTMLHWIFVVREIDGDIFRVQIGDPHAFGPIVQGRIVRLSRISSWRNKSYQEETLAVLGIE